VESNLPGLDFSVLLVDLVTHQNDWNVVADSGQVLVPLWHVLVCDSGGDIEHQNSSIGANVIPFSEPTELFLASSIPEGELDRAVIGVESNGTNFNTLSGDVFFFKLTSDVSLDKGSLTDTTVSDENDFKLSNDLRTLHV
jgi:hypothetical protein